MASFFGFVQFLGVLLQRAHHYFLRILGEEDEI